MAAERLTEEQQQAYLAASGGKCPFCQSKNLEADVLDADGPTATGSVTCADCGETWQDIYTLTGVTATTDD